MNTYGSHNANMANVRVRDDAARAAASDLLLRVQRVWIAAAEGAKSVEDMVDYLATLVLRSEKLAWCRDHALSRDVVIPCTAHAADGGDDEWAVDVHLCADDLFGGELSVLGTPTDELVSSALHRALPDPEWLPAQCARLCPALTNGEWDRKMGVAFRGKLRVEVARMLPDIVTDRSTLKTVVGFVRLFCTQQTLPDEDVIVNESVGMVQHTVALFGKDVGRRMMWRIVAGFVSEPAFKATWSYATLFLFSQTREILGLQEMRDEDAEALRDSSQPWKNSFHRIASAVRQPQEVPWSTVPRGVGCTTPGAAQCSVPCLRAMGNVCEDEN